MGEGEEEDVAVDLIEHAQHHHSCHPHQQRFFIAVLPVPAPCSIVPRHLQVLSGRHGHRAGGGEGGPAAQGRIVGVSLHSRSLCRVPPEPGAQGG